MAADREQAVLRPAGDQIDRPLAAEQRPPVGRRQPGDRVLIAREHDPQRFVDAEHGRDPQQDVESQREALAAPRPLRPGIEGRAPRQPEQPQPLLLGQAPAVGDGQKGAHRGAAEPPPLAGTRERGIDLRRSFREVLRLDGTRVQRHLFSPLTVLIQI
jgi:hypothetical protein